MKLDNLSSQVYVVAVNEAKINGHEYVTPEHFLYSCLLFEEGKNLIISGGGKEEYVVKDLMNFFLNEMPGKKGSLPMESYGFIQMFESAAFISNARGLNNITIREIILSIMSLKESHARYILETNGFTKENLATSIYENKKPSVDFQDRKAVAIKYTTDMLEKAELNEYDNLIGRQDITTRIVHILARRLKNNPILVGEPGVGKTAIIEGLATLALSPDAPLALKNCTILQLDMAALIAGTRYRGDFEERLVKLFEAVKQLDNPIVYIDEIHTVVGAGAVSGSSMDASGVIKPLLQHGEIRFIGTTTHEDYRKYLEKDRALVRRFARIDVNEPSREECVEILKGLVPYYELHHGVIYYSNKLLEQIVDLSIKHLSDKFLPDKAIDLMDDAGVYTKLNTTRPFKVTANIIEKVIAQVAKIPEKNVGSNEILVLKNLDKDLRSRVYGQDEAVQTITEVIYASRSGLNDPNRPIAGLLFTGPTGVGKTEIAKQLAELTNIKLIRFDMSEYQEKHAVARLIGSPPGYVGYEEGGLLTEALRKSPHCVLLLDEIEKAHADILNVLLQILDYGTLTDNTGKKADFKNSIIIMTSNAGAREMSTRTIGFDGELDSHAAIKAIEKMFSPEFINRLDRIIKFNPVDNKMSKQIAKKALNILVEKLAAKDVELIITPQALQYVASKGLSEKYGAREIIRVVENDIKRLLVKEVLFGKMAKGGVCRLKVIKGELVVE